MAEKEQEKNQFVKQVAEQKYEFGFTTDVHTEIIEKGCCAPHLTEEGRARLDARISSESLPLLEDAQGAKVGTRTRATC